MIKNTRYFLAVINTHLDTSQIWNNDEIQYLMQMGSKNSVDHE
jgi:hypothetical protein